jgi:outer membrane protein TolC
VSVPSSLAGAILAGLLATGCAKFTGDGGMAPVTEGVRREIGKDVAKHASPEDLRRAHERVQAMLTEELSEDTAVQIALLNNRGLQAAYNDLGVSEAEYVQASTPPNPALSVARTFGTADAGFGTFAGLGLGLVGNLLAFVTLPRRTYRAIATTLSFAMDVRRAWVRAVAAQQRLGLLQQAREAADASAAMMKQLGETGGANKLDQGRVAAFYADLSAQVGLARLTVRREREALTRLLGVWGADIEFKLPARLPALPATPESMADVEKEAMRRRVDLIILRYEVETLAKSVGFVNATRYVTFLQLGGLYENQFETGVEPLPVNINRAGLDLAVSIPIFDTGKARLTQAQEIYMRIINRLAERSINARSEARAAYAAYRASYDVARYYQTRILPLRRQISAEALLRYNGMLIDVFELLIEERERISASLAAQDELRDFYLADADLQAALIVGGTVPPSGVINTTPPPETIPLGVP